MSKSLPPESGAVNTATIKTDKSKRSRPDRLTCATRRAFRMCVWHYTRIKAGGHTLSVPELAKKFTVSERTIHRWIAVAKEHGVLRMERTGRRPFWRVNRDFIDTLRQRSNATYGRSREGHLSHRARNMRFGYREACFAYWLENHPSADLTKTTPHTPIASTPFGFLPPIQQIPPSSYSSFPYDSPTRVRARAEIEAEKAEKRAELRAGVFIAAKGVSAQGENGVAAVMLRLAAAAGSAGQRSAARAVARSGLFCDANGAPLNVSSVRRVLEQSPRYRANGSDSERNATRLQKEGV